MLLGGSLSGKELKLASYNIRHGADINYKMNLAGTLAVLKKMDADVIALQEVDKRCTRSNKVDQAKYLGDKLGMHHAFGKFMDFQGGEYGMAILSKYPILETKIHKLPAGGEPRVAVEIIVEVAKGQKASFVSIHFDWTTEERRQPQIKALLKGLEKRTHPVALIGDFNATPKSKSMALFKQDWVNIPKKGNGFTFPADKPAKEIDYFVLRGFEAKGVTCEVVNEVKASDHRPIRMSITISDKKTK